MLGDLFACKCGKSIFEKIVFVCVDSFHPVKQGVNKVIMLQGIVQVTRCRIQISDIHPNFIMILF